MRVFRLAHGPPSEGAGGARRAVEPLDPEQRPVTAAEAAARRDRRGRRRSEVLRGCRGGELHAARENRREGGGAQGPAGFFSYPVKWGRPAARRRAAGRPVDLTP